MPTETTTALPVTQLTRSEWRDLLRAANQDQVEDHRRQRRIELRARAAERRRWS